MFQYENKCICIDFFSRHSSAIPILFNLKYKIYKYAWYIINYIYIRKKIYYIISIQIIIESTIEVVKREFS